VKLTYNSYESYFPEVKDITDEAQAEQFAIDFSNWQPEQDLSYGEVVAFQNYFEEIAKKFPNPKEEFEENGII